jgi:hypothetical protein
MNKKTLFLVASIIVIPILFYVLKPKDDQREPITLKGYSSYIVMSIDDLISNSDLIVIGNLSRVHTSRWNSPNGKRPAQGIHAGDLIFTDRDFSITQLIKGKTQQENVRIRSIGGTIDGDSEVTDNVTPEMNKTYLLFLNLDTVGSTANIVPGHYWITGGGFQGLYEIIGDKAISASDEWKLDELIAYIQKSLSTEISPQPATLTAPTDLPVQTITPEVIITAAP